MAANNPFGRKTCLNGLALLPALIRGAKETGSGPVNWLIDRYHMTQVRTFRENGAYPPEVDQRSLIGYFNTMNSNRSSITSTMMMPLSILEAGRFGM